MPVFLSKCQIWLNLLPKVLSRLQKEVGDFVSQDETIATIETDKIDVEVNAPVSGTITDFS